MSKLKNDGSVYFHQIPGLFGYQIATLICPSDPSGRDMVTGSNYSMGKMNYMSCNGDYLTQTEYMKKKAGAEEWIFGKERGGFSTFSWKSIASIVDGTSNTVAYGECVSSETEEDDRRVLGGVGVGGLKINVDPSLCLDIRDPANPTMFRASVKSPVVTQRGRRLLYGRQCNGGFQTVLPPNSPSCSPNTNVQNNSYAIYSASSFHPGGVNVLFFDGAVRFISETINTGKMDAPQDLFGESPYGVWGSYGSIAGGESKTL